MRNEQIREAKATLRQWFSDDQIADDAYLTRVVDECRAGTFRFDSQCYCARGLLDGGYDGTLASTDAACGAETALWFLSGVDFDRLKFPGLWPRPDCPHGSSAYGCHLCEHLRRVRTLPMALAEIRRRERARDTVPAEPEKVEA